MIERSCSTVSSEQRDVRRESCLSLIALPGACGRRHGYGRGRGESAKNACYFFNRLDRSGARYVSYHYADRPELKGEFSEEAVETIKMLTEG